MKNKKHFFNLTSSLELFSKSMSLFYSYKDMEQRRSLTDRLVILKVHLPNKLRQLLDSAVQSQQGLTSTWASDQLTSHSNQIMVYIIFTVKCHKDKMSLGLFTAILLSISQLWVPYFLLIHPLEVISCLYLPGHSFESMTATTLWTPPGYVYKAQPSLR